MRLLLLFLALVVCGCDRSPSPPARVSGGRQVVTTFYPMKYFAERIGASSIDVSCPCPQDADPAEWSPSRETLQLFQNADLVLANGAEFEGWMHSASLPASRVVKTADAGGIDLIRVKGQVHSHGAAGSHSHTETDGHTWLDPVNAMSQAGSIHKAMRSRWPDQSQAFDTGYEALSADLLALDTRLRGLEPLMRDAVVFTSHPAYSYLARRYGWKVIDLDAPPDQVISDECWRAMRDALVAVGDARPRLMLFETTPLAATREALKAELRIETVAFSPCEAEQDGLDYLARMNSNIDDLQQALSKGK